MSCSSRGALEIEDASTAWIEGVRIVVVRLRFVLFYLGEGIVRVTTTFIHAVDGTLIFRIGRNDELLSVQISSARTMGRAGDACRKPLRLLPQQLGFSSSSIMPRDL